MIPPDRRHRHASGDWIARDLGDCLIGGLILAGALVTLRSRGLPLFVEQLAVPALLVAGSLGFAVGRDLPNALAAVARGPRTGAGGGPAGLVGVLLGAAAASLLTLALILALEARTEPLMALWEGRHAGWVALHWPLGPG